MYDIVLRWKFENSKDGVIHQFFLKKHEPSIITANKLKPRGHTVLVLNVPFFMTQVN